MDVIVRTLFNQHGKQMGVILTANLNYIPTTKQKAMLEDDLKNYAHAYYRIPLSIFSHSEQDTPAIVVITEINSLPQTQIII